MSITNKVFLLGFGINILITSNVYSHGGMAPPVDSTNSGGKSHAGFGNLGGNDFEASQKLRKNCLSHDISKYQYDIAAACLKRNPSFAAEDLHSLLSGGARLITQKKLQAYAASVLASDIYLLKNKLSISDYPNPRTCNGIEEPNPAPHAEVRKSAMSVENAVSAAFLDKVLNPKTDDAYRERIRRNYPYLFTPMQFNPLDNSFIFLNNTIAAQPQYRQLFNFEVVPTVNSNGVQISIASHKILRLLKKYLGNAYKDQGNMFDHSQTMDAFEAKMQMDPIFRSEIENTVREIQKKYAEFQDEKLKNICSMSMQEIAKSFPAIFDQFLIDLDPVASDVAQYSLCKDKFYYDERTFDSDCDGIVDKDDRSPSDPFSPISSFVVSGTNYINPPFRARGIRDVVKSGSTISLTRSINLSNMTNSDSSKVIGKMNKCSSKLKRTIESSFVDFAKDNPSFQGLNLDVKIQFETTGNSSDFKIHECWCSTCKLFYNDPVKGKSLVPKSTCRKDFTAEMTAALNDTSLNPDKKLRRWMMQEDAGNLTVNSLDDCKTINHEIMHKFGLADEYVASYYPFNLIGEHDSLMHRGEKLYPRHIGDLLSPWKCERNRGNYGL